MSSKSILAAIFLLSFSGAAQTLSTTKIKQLGESKLIEAISDFREFLEIPNDGNYKENVYSNLEWCRENFESKGFIVSQLETPGMPLLLAEKVINKDAKTALFYLQIDGQPVDTSAWSQPSPYQAVLKESDGDNKWKIIDWQSLDGELNMDWRISARSASDSKGPAMSLMQAIDVLDENDITPAFNVKIIMDFQEELGSRDLPGAVKEYSDELSADFLVIMDGVRSVVNQPTLTFGARGIATATLTVYGPKSPLHSGQFGNFAPNPVFAASRLIAGMKDNEGRVTIPGFYDGVSLSEADRKILNNVPDDIDEIKGNVGIMVADGIGETYQESLQYPSLNVRGMQAAWVGKEVRTIIPSEVVIEIDMRLVPETPGQRQVDLLKKHVVDQGYYLIDREPTDDERTQYPKIASFKYRLGSAPFRTEYGTPIDQWLTSAVTRATGMRPIRMRTTGGSQPIGPFINTLNIPAIAVRIPNPGNNIHAPDENLRIGNFLEGIQTCIGILTEPIPTK